MKSKISAFGDKIVAKKIVATAKTASGFILPDSAKEEIHVAEVVSVGKDVKEINVGDRIFYSNYSSPVKIDGVEYVYTKEEDVYFKVA